jgi:hypothetical protein
MIELFRGLKGNNDRGDSCMEWNLQAFEGVFEAKPVYQITQ